MTIQRPILKHPFSDLARRGQTPPGDLIQDQIIETHRAIDQVIDALADMQAKAAAQPPQAGTLATMPESFERSAVMLSENSAENWSVASWQWSEHMDGALPADTVAMFDITGDHWSARYWANQALVILEDAEDWGEQAAASAAAAAASAADAAASADLADEWGDLYLGSHAVAPTTDNDGDPLQTGALYFDTAVVQMRSWNGTVWQGFETLGDVASDVIFAPAAGIAATNVQAAIVEALADSKAYADGLLGGLVAPYTKAESDTKFVDVAGDAMTGDLVISKSDPVLVINKASSGQNNHIIGARAGAYRWIMLPGDTAAEVGANAGSDFGVNRYDDAGALLGQPFHISRATGSATFQNIPICAVAPTVDSHLANRAYVEFSASAWGAAHASARVAKAGDTMTGGLTVNANSNYAGQSAIMIYNAGDSFLSFHTGGYALNLGLSATGNTFYLGGWSQGGHRWYSDSAGNFTATGNVTAYSDARRKKDVVTISEALDLVKRMRGVRYQRTDTVERGVGVIAQEMQEIVPEVVMEDPGGDRMLSVAYGNLVGVLIEAIKELAARVEELENRT